MLELAVTIKTPSQLTDDVKLTRGEPPCLKHILKCLDENMHFFFLKCTSESFISSRGGASCFFTFTHTAVTTPGLIAAYLHVCVGGPLQMCEMVRPLSPSNAIIAAASLSFLPEDSPWLSYTEGARLTALSPSLGDGQKGGSRVKSVPFIKGFLSVTNKLLIWI